MRALVVVDDPHSADVACRCLLAARGFAIAADRAVTVPDALAMLDRTAYDIVLVHDRLGTRDGRTDGPALMPELRRRWPSTSVILLTQERSPAVDQAATDAGAVDCLEMGELSSPVLEHALRYAAERRRLAAHTSANDALLETVIRHMPEGLVVVECPSERVLITNPAMDRMTGSQPFAPGARVGDRVHALRHPDGRLLREDERPLIRALRHGEVIDSEYYDVTHPDGTVRAVRVGAAPIYDPEGRRIGAIGSLYDVTERRRTGEALRFQARLLDAVDQAVIASDVDGRITYWNRCAQVLSGWTRAEALGRLAADVLVASADPPAGAVSAPLLGSGESWSGELEMRCADGASLPVLVTHSPIHDERGALTGFVCVATDIRDRRKLEEQIRQSQKMEAVGQLAGGIAHDFNNILTVIRTLGEILLDDTRIHDAARADVAEIAKAARSAASITGQLLAFSRRQMLRPRPTDVNETIVHLVPMLQRLIGEDIVVRTVLDGRATLAQADPSQLEQVLLNFSVNARDAMPAGGTLTFATRCVDIGPLEPRWGPTVPAGAFVQIDVVDTGCGMDEVTQARIFEPFFTTKQPGHGTGLGLATVYGIVKQLGGHVRVESRKGTGTTFSVILPAAGEAIDGPLEAERRPAQSPGPRERPTVLVVEDDPAVRTLATRVLETRGFQVLAAGSAGEASAVARSHSGPIGLVVTDMVLPDGSGTDAYRSVCAQRPSVPVLYMSGYTDDDIFRRGLSDASASFLQKPFSAVDLHQAVEEALAPLAGSAG